MSTQEELIINRSVSTGTRQRIRNNRFIQCDAETYSLYNARGRTALGLTAKELNLIS